MTATERSELVALCVGVLIFVGGVLWVFAYAMAGFAGLFAYIMGWDPTGILGIIVWLEGVAATFEVPAIVAMVVLVAALILRGCMMLTVGTQDILEDLVEGRMYGDGTNAANERGTSLWDGARLGGFSFGLLCALGMGFGVLVLVWLADRVGVPISFISTGGIIVWSGFAKIMVSRLSSEPARLGVFVGIVLSAVVLGALVQDWLLELIKISGLLVGLMIASVLLGVVLMIISRIRRTRSERS